MSYDLSTKQNGPEKWAPNYFDNDVPSPYAACQFPQNGIQEREAEQHRLSSQHVNWEKGRVSVPPILDSYGVPFSTVSGFYPSNSFMYASSNVFNYAPSTCSESNEPKQFCCSCSGIIMVKHVHFSAYNPKIENDF